MLNFDDLTVTEIGRHIFPHSSTAQMALHPDKNHIAMGSFESAIFVYSLPDFNPVHFCDHENPTSAALGSLLFITSTDLDDDSDKKRPFDRKQDLIYLAASAGDGSVRVWNLTGVGN